VRPIGRIGSPRERLARAMQALLDDSTSLAIGELAQSLVGLAPNDLADALAKMDRMQHAIEIASGLARAEVKRRTDAARLVAADLIEDDVTRDRNLDRSELAHVRIRTDTLEDDSADG
jgi:hypothetical protein